MTAKDPDLSHTQHAMRGLRLVGSARLFSQCVTWGLTVVTVRLLQPADYGLVATAGLFTVLASMVTDGGLSEVLIFRRDVSDRLQGAAAVGGMLLSSTLALFIVLIAPLGAAFFRNPALAPVLRVAALQLPLSALAIVPYALLSKEMLYGRMAIIQTFASILQGVATLVMAYMGAAYWSLICGTLFGSALRAISLWLALKERPALNWHVLELRPMLGDSYRLIGQRLIYFGIADFDIFLLGRFRGTVELGPYSLAKTLAHAVLDQISGTVNQITLPSFAAKHGDPPAQLAALKTIIATAATVVFPLFWFGGLISKVAFPLIFGPRWAALIFPFIALTLLLPLRTIYALLSNAIIGTGHTSITFKNMIVWAAVMIPVLLIGALQGPNAVAVAWVVGFPLVFLSAMNRIAHGFNLRLQDLLRPLIIPAACTATTAVMVESLTLASEAFCPPIVLLPMQIVVAGGLYWALLSRFGRSQFNQVRQLTGQLLRR